MSCCTGPGVGGRAMLACFWREGLRPRARCQVVWFLPDRRGSLHRKTPPCDCCTAVGLPCTLHADPCMEGVFWFGCLNSCTATSRAVQLSSPESIRGTRRAWQGVWLLAQLAAPHDCVLATTLFHSSSAAVLVLSLALRREPCYLCVCSCACMERGACGGATTCVLLAM
jgi:hypothetical protein